jgi:threonylcarbamoyladenosine tRNA methylthiotransferase MtaB
MASAQVRVLTLGCKVNQCDSEEIARALVARGYGVGGAGQAADIYIVNTCTVTTTADAKARKLIRRLAREHPAATLIVTGCLAQVDPYSLLELPGVTAVVPNSRKMALADFLPDLQAPLLPATYLPTRTRAFVKLQDGCDHRCTYCAVPEARGNPASKPLAAALAELTSLAESGAKEVVLCGIRLGAYGRERGEGTLTELLQAARGLSIPRLRLSSIEPMDLDEELLKEIADHPTLCHHLHLPLQSGDDDVLARMGRAYTTQGFADLVGRVRRSWPEAAITTDVMVGFPGESDEQFERSFEFVSGVRFARIHVFPFSRRPNTPAATFPDQVPTKVTRERAQRMLRLAQEAAAAAAGSWVGQAVSVLLEEKDEADLLVGHTAHYLRVHVPAPEQWVGRIVEVTPTRQQDGELYV